MHSLGNNEFGKGVNPITKTEFTLYIIPSAFHKQENEKWILIVSPLAQKKEKRKQLGTVMSLSPRWCCISLQ